MKLWFISQGERNGYDVFDSAVVAAETEEEARRIHPQITWEWGDRDYWAEKTGTWASTPDKVDVDFIGEAVAGTEAGVVLASFNAGQSFIS